MYRHWNPTGNEQVTARVQVYLRRYDKGQLRTAEKQPTLQSKLYVV